MYSYKTKKLVTSGVLVADEVQEFEQVKMLVGHMYHRTKRKFKVIDPYRKGPLAKEMLELRDDRGNVLGEIPCQRITHGHVLVIPTIFSKNDEYYTLKEVTTLLRNGQKKTIAEYELAEVTESLNKTTLTTHFVTTAGQQLCRADKQTITWKTLKYRDVKTNRSWSGSSIPEESNYLAVKSPLIMGYVAQTAGLGPASLKAKEQQIVYQKLGKIIAIDNGGNILGTKKYCNDRTDPTRAAETFLPYIKGYHRAIKAEAILPSDPRCDIVIKSLAN